MRVAIYARVSRPEQAEGYSLDAQLRACRKHAAERGWTVIEEYVEPGLSAKTDQRPEFQRIIAEAKSGHFDVILVHKLDRFARSAVDILRYSKLFRDLGIAWVCIAEQFDFTSPTGKVILAVLAALAEWYLDNLSRETKKGKRERALQGLWNGDPQWGDADAGPGNGQAPLCHDNLGLFS